MDKNERLVTITRVEHLGRSMNGNPYYRLHLDDGTSLRTKIDSMVNIGIENSENLNRPITVTLSPGGRVVYGYRHHPEQTPILFEVGNIVKCARFPCELGVVLEVDRENAAVGGTMNYRVVMIADGKIISKAWWTNDELRLVDDGS